MEDLVAGFANQIKDALAIGAKARLSNAKVPIQNILINGMGGSGIGGTIVSELIANKSRVPIMVSKSYLLPEYVDKNTLVIISSYSGNTEETILCLESALKKGAKAVCITSGGEILKIAQAEGIDHIIIPSGMPPRAAVGYSMVQTFFVLSHYGVIDKYFEDDFEQARNLIIEEEENIKKEAKRIADIILNKFVVIYTPARSEGVAVRLRQDLNENSKVLASHNTIPEMNHNEILGWSGRRDDFAVIFFRNTSDYSQISKRIDLTKEMILKYAGNVIEIYSKGETAIERAIYHIHISDWISVILAKDRGVDPSDIQVIEHLKSMLK